MNRLIFTSMVVVLLVSCQGTQAPPVISTATPNATKPVEQPVQLDQPSATPIVTLISPPMPLPDKLSPTLSATSTPQGISQEMDALIPPIPPAQLSATRQDLGILLTWMGTGSDIDTHYNVYRRDTASGEWQVIASVAVLKDNRGAYSYLDLPPESGDAVSYAVSTVDRYGKESSPANIDMESSP